MHPLTSHLQQHESVRERARFLFTEGKEATYRRTDRMFAWLMGIQWVVGIAAALWLSPKAWDGAYSHTHIHVWTALFLGGAISGFPIFAAWRWPGSILTRHVIAVGQMLTSGLLVHLSGGRIETHFHYFGSLAFLAFYRDWRVLLTATLVATTDHFLRGMFWPQSLFGLLVVSPWRWLEHVGWIVFEDVFLLIAMRQNLAVMFGMAEREANLENLHLTLEEKVKGRTIELTNEIAERAHMEISLRESEEKFHQLVDNISDVFWITSPDLKIMHYVSAGYETVWGRSIKSLYANPHQWIESILAEDHAQVLGIFGGLMADLPQVSVEYRIARPDGSIRWIHDRGFQVRDAAGKLVRLTGIASDITERKAIEDKLLRNQSLQRIAGKISRVGGWAIAMPDNDVYWSSEVWDILGFPRGEEPSLEEALKLYTPASREKLGAAIALCATEGSSFDLDVDMEEANGRQMWARISGEAERDAHGIIRRVNGAFSDITDRKRAEAKLAYERDLLRTLLDNSPDHIYFKDTKSRFIKSSAAQARQFGVPSTDDLVGKSDFDFFSEAHARPAYEDEQEIIRTGLPLIGKVEREHWSDGREDSWVLTTKMPLLNSAGEIIGTVGISKNITAMKRAELALVESQLFLQSTLDALSAHIAILDEHGKILEINRAWKLFAQANHFLGGNCGEGDNYLGICDAAIGERAIQAPAAVQGIRAVMAGEMNEFQIEYPCHSPQEQRWFIMRATRFISEGTVRVVIAHETITERKRMETQLFQSQKLETVGKLAGGIAHEFNSIMTAIIGQSELLLVDLPMGNPLRKNATEISKAADRAAALTRQLLAYGRKQILRPEILDLNTVLSGMTTVLRHSLGENVDLRIVPDRGLKKTLADAGQIEQVIVNIALNAAAAMPNGGKLTIETNNVTLDASNLSRFPDGKVGEYVRLAITDTGTGMSEAVQARLFEPFFTTKDVGQGTGLGLATCYGIIKQSGGHLDVHSELGQGTTFQIYLPQVEPQSPALLPLAGSSSLPGGTETILLVEDDPALREMASTLLERLGYTLLSASNALEALEMTGQPGRGPIDLLVTALSGMSGESLAAHVLAQHPGAAVLYTSAHAEPIGTHRYFLLKPFTPAALTRKIREILDQSLRL